MTEKTPSEMDLEFEKLIDSVHDAFKKYRENFVAMPHGTRKQIAAMLEFGTRHYFAVALRAERLRILESDEVRDLVKTLKNCHRQDCACFQFPPYWCDCGSNTALSAFQKFKDEKGE